MDKKLKTAGSYTVRYSADGEGSMGATFNVDRALLL